MKQVRPAPLPGQQPWKRILELARQLDSEAPQGWRRLLPGTKSRHMQRLRTRIIASENREALAGLRALDAGKFESFDELRAALLFVSQTNDHRRFEACLRRYDPQLPAWGRGPRAFYGRGSGMSSLPVMRRLGDGAGARFEKVYEKGGRGHHRMHFALGHVLAKHPVVTFPKLLAERSGARLTVVEFEWRPGGRPGPVWLGLDIARRLGSLVPQMIAGAEAHAANYWLIRNRDRLALRLGGAAEPLDRALLWIESQPRLFSHGDLGPYNFDSEGLVWDWDSAGMRAYGYDAACCAGALAHKDAAAVLALSREAVERPGHEAADRLAFVTFTLGLLPTSALHWKQPGLAEDLAAALPALLQAVA